MPTFLDQDLNVDTVNTTGDVDIEGNVNVVGTPVDGSQVVIRDTTTSSANAGGSLRLSSNDGSPMGDSHRLGVIEFTGAEDSSNTQIVGARIEALIDAAWTNVENGCALYFYTTDGNNSQTNVLKIDSNKKSTFNGVIDVTDTTDSSDATGDTGALRVEGGASIAKKLFVGENLTVTGDLTVNGTTTTVSTTNTVVSDKLLELANGTSGTPSGDAGIIIERGSSNNAAIIWDESTDTFVVGTTTATGASTGDLSVTDAAFQAAAITASGDISTTGEVKTAKVSYTDGDDAITIADGGGITANTSLTLASGATVTAIKDEDAMGSNSATALATQQSIKAYVDSQTSGAGNMDNWILEDDDGTEVTVSNGKEVKFIGSGITTNFTDTSDGSDADPFDLTFTVDAAQTGITSVVNSSLEIGRDADNRIKFGTDNQIIFEVDGGDNVIFKTGGEIEATSLDIGGDADIDGTLEADAITVDGVALNEYIADTVGAMVGSNTESGITVAYQDADNTLDFTVGTLNQDTTGTAAIATTVTCADESSDTTCFVGYVTAATGDLGLKTGSNLTFNSSSGLLTATQLAGTLQTAAQANITSVGTLTALTVDDVAVDGKVITMTGSTDDTAVITVGTNGTLDITTTDTAAAAANIQITADGTAELAGTTVTLDSGADVVLSAGGGNVTMDDGSTTIFDFNTADTSLTIHDDQDTGDNFKITVAQHGATTIATVDDDAAAADLTLDIDGDIVLDSGEGKWRFKKGGSGRLKVDEDNSGDVQIELSQADKKLEFKGTDSSSGITALELDMALAGKATFNGGVVSTAAANTFGATSFNDANITNVGDIALDSISADGTTIGIACDTVTFDSANSEDPLIIIKNTTNDANGARLRFVKDKGAAGADNDVAGAIEFYADDDNQDNILFGKIEGIVADASNGAEGGRVTISVASHDGEIQPGLVVEDGGGEDEVNVTIGNVTTSKTSVSGALGVRDSAPKVSLNVVHDYNTATFENQLADGEGGGRVLRYSPGADDTLTVGGLYFLHTDGTWDAADADAVATGASQMLGIGLGNARTAGLLMEGFIRIPSTEILNVPGSGAVDGLPLYVSTTAAHLDFTAPSGGGDFVRIVGHAIDDDSGDVLIYFNPSNNWVEL